MSMILAFLARIISAGGCRLQVVVRTPLSLEGKGQGEGPSLQSFPTLVLEVVRLF